jgi:hypothetical protein
VSRAGLVGAYFVIQGGVVAAWWAVLIAWPGTRALFFGPDLDEPIQNAFILPDLAILSVCSLVAGAAAWRAARWAKSAGWLVAGAFLYASLLSYPLVVAGHLTMFSAILMSSATLGSFLAAGCAK